MAIAKNRDASGLSFKPLASEFFLVLPQKRVIWTGGAAHFAQLRKESRNEDCL
jgi:hypothetical protein